MKKFLLIACTLISCTCFAQTGDFNSSPWLKDKYPIIIDPYYGNSIQFDKLQTDTRVVAIIHKASQGLSKDKKYMERRTLAAAKNIFFASYHLGTSADPVKQADYYLSLVQDMPDQPMALDIEDYEATGTGKPYMPLANAIIFINRVHEKTGKYPLLYINNKVFNEINRRYDKTSVFAQCALWYARFINPLPALSTKIWDRVTIWQFSSEINCSQTGKCLYNVPGTAYDMDVNVFNGDREQLLQLWKL